MSFTSYLFEKACFVPESMGRVAEDLKILPVRSVAQREATAHLNVALRYGLKTCCEIAGEDYDAEWVVGIARDGSTAWEPIRTALEDAIWGPALPDDGGPKPFGTSRPDPDEEAQNEVDATAVGVLAAKTLLALVDLSDSLRGHGCYDLSDARFRSTRLQARPERLSPLYLRD